MNEFETELINQLKKINFNIEILIEKVTYVADNFEEFNEAQKYK